ncbi:DNA-directed RNA polymerase II subunit RPB9 [Intoshia linei]|uniref:DNA-directed RNA polymerase subunit n=1 Tax=Intoshia linei TaxID=1819745 RepID=A0A177BCQ4_9BILA|nr:DNA-directed RNA polymerase II subunit RPB9 [Intoshia linei]
MVKKAFTSVVFCQECNNMLYPKPNEQEKVLMFVCRNCHFEEVASNNCVYVNNIKHETDELTQIVPDVISDPSLPRTEEHACPKCKRKEAVFFQSKSLSEGMRLYYVCCNEECLNKWTE